MAAPTESPGTAVGLPERFADVGALEDFMTEPTPALFTSAAGTRLLYCNVHLAFKRIVARAGRLKNLMRRPVFNDSIAMQRATFE